ncbi:MAG: ABC transporter permease [Acidimicrobiales bacterium]
MSPSEDRFGSRRVRAFMRNRLAVVGLVYLILIVVCAAFAPLLFSRKPSELDVSNRFAGPFSHGHLLGADSLGRDLLTQVVYAARVSLLAGFGSVALALCVAVPVGLVAGYYGRWIEAVVMRAADLLLAIPPLILVFAVAGILGASLRNAVIALSVYFAPLFIRLVVTEVRRLRDGQLVESARAVGSTDRFIMVRHVLPNIASPLIVQASLSTGVAIIAEASLSYLGLGVRPPTPTWGVMVRTAFDFIQRDAWAVVVPSVAMAFTVLAFNFVGDGLRDALNRPES